MQADRRTDVLLDLSILLEDQYCLVVGFILSRIKPDFDWLQLSGHRFLEVFQCIWSFLSDLPLVWARLQALKVASGGADRRLGDQVQVAVGNIVRDRLD